MERKVKILYIGSFCPPSIMQELMKRKTQITASTTTFQRAFLSGFRNINKDIHIINIPDIGSFPLRCQNPFFKTKPLEYYDFQGINCGFLNITYFKRYFIERSLLEHAVAWISKNQDSQIIIVVYSMIYPYLKTAIRLKKRFSNVKICCIVADLPEYFGDSNSLLLKVLGKHTIKQSYEFAHDIDAFVLLTDAMKSKLHCEDKPYMIMEGIYNPANVPDVEKNKKTIVYTGKLDARFGIRTLIDAFRLINDTEFKLHICGNGLDRPYVESAANTDSRIIYHGVLPQEEVFKMQKAATLLVNPRSSEGEYTKYSFPSKSMEYLASGTPTLMHILPGMPQEYHKHIVQITDDTPQTLASLMEEWGKKPQSILDDFGENAKRFIIQNKNSDIQIEKFLKFLDKI